MSYAPRYQTHSLPRRSCLHHIDEYNTNSLPRSPRIGHHVHDHENNHLYSAYELIPTLNVSMSNDRIQEHSPSYVNVVSDQSTSSHQLQKVPQLTSSTQDEIMCSTCSSSTNTDDSANENDASPADESDQEIHPSHSCKNANEKEIFIDFKPIDEPNEDGISSYERTAQQLPEKIDMIRKLSSGRCRSSQDLTPEEGSDYGRYSTHSKESISSKTQLKADKESSEEEKISFESNDEMQKEHSEGAWNVSQATTVVFKQNSSPTESLEQSSTQDSRCNSTNIKTGDFDIEDFADQVGSSKLTFSD